MSEKVWTQEERARAMLAALRGVKRLFEEPSRFYIKKFGGPITNRDQDKIDAVFQAVESAISNGGAA